MPRLTTPQTHPSYRITDTRGTSCSKHATCRHPDTAVVVRNQKAPTHDDELTSQISPDHTNRTDVKRKEDEEEMNSLFADNDAVLQLPLTAAPSTSFSFPSHVGPRTDGQSTAEQRLLTPQNTQRRVVRPQTTTATTAQTPFSSTATATTAIDRNSNKKEKTKDGESRAEANAVVEAHTTEAEEKSEGEEEEEVVDLVQATPQPLRSQKKDSTTETRRKRSGGDDSILDAPLTADSAPLPSSSSSTAAVAVMVSSTRREPTHVRQVHFPAATCTPLPLPLSPRNINEEANSSSSRNRAGTSKVSAASTAGVDTTTNSRVLAAPPHLPIVRLPAAVRDPTLGVAAPPSRAVADAVAPNRLTADPTPITTLQYTDNTEDKSETRRRVSGLTEDQHRHLGGDGNGGRVAAAAAQMQTAHVWLPRRVEYLSEAPPLPQSHGRGGGAGDGAPYVANQNRTRQEVDGSAIPQSVLWRRRQQEPSSLSSLSVEVTALHHPDQHQRQQQGRAQDDADVASTGRRDAYQHPSESVAPAPLSAAQWCVTAFESVTVHFFSEHASNSTAQKKTRQAHDAEDHDVSVRGRGGVEATVGVPNSSNDDRTNEDEEKGGVEDDDEGSCTDSSEDVDDTDSESGAAMPTPTAAAHVSSSRAGQRGGTRVSSTLARSHQRFYDTDAASTRGDANGEGDGNEHEDDEEEEAAAAGGVVARSVRRERGHRRPRSRSRYATSHHRHSNKNNNNSDYQDGRPATRRRLDRKESTGRQAACRTRCVDDHNDDGVAECPEDAQPTVHGPPSVAGAPRSSGDGPAACTLQLRVTLPWMLQASALPAGVSARLLQCLESHTRATLSASLCEDLHKNTHAVQPLIDRSVADASGVAADTVGRAATAAADGGGVCCDATASPPPFWIAAFAYTHSIQSQATTAAARLVHELEAMTVARSGLSMDHSRRAPHNRDGGVDSVLDGTVNAARGAQQAQAASALSPGRTISQQHSRQTLLEHVECVRWPAWVPATHTATLVLAALTSAAFVLMNDISQALHRATVKQADGADGHAHAGTSGSEKTSRGKADGTPRHTTTLNTAVHAFSGFCAAVFGEEECSRLCRHVRDRLPLHSRELRGMMQLSAPPRPMPGRPDANGGVGGGASHSSKAAHGGCTSHGRGAEAAGRDAAAAESSWPSLLDVIHHLARVWMRLCFPKLAARLHSFLVTHNPGVVLDGWWRVQSERNSTSCSPGAADAASSAVQKTEAARAGETSSDDLRRRVYDALHWFVFGLLQRWEKWSLLPAPQTHTNAAAASAKGLSADVLAGFSPLSSSRSDGVQWRAHVNFGTVQALRCTLHHVWVPYADTTDDEHVGASSLGLSADVHSANSNHKQHQQRWSSSMADADRRASKLSINTTTRSSTMYAVRVDAMAVLEHLSLLPVLLETLLLRQEVTSVLQRAITGTQKCESDNTLSTRLNAFHACFRLFFGVCCYGASLVPLTAAEKKTGNASGKEESELTVPFTRTALQKEVVEGVWREWMLPLLVQYVDSDSAIHHHHHHHQQQQQLSRTSEGTDGPADYEASERCHAHSSCPRRVRLLIIAHEMTVYALTLLQLVQEGQRTGSHRHSTATVVTHSRKRTRSAASSTLSDRSHHQRHSHHDRRLFLPVSQPNPTPQQQQQSSLPSASSSRRPQWRPTAIPHNAQRSEDVVGGGGGAHNGGWCCSPYSVSSLTDASATTMTSVASLRTLVSVSTATTQSVVAPRQTIASATAASAGAAGGAAVESIPMSQLHYAWEGRCASPQQKQPQPSHRDAEHREEERQCTEADALSSAAAAMCGGHRFPWVVPSLRPECLGGCSTGSIPGVSSHGVSSGKTAPAADWRAACRAAVRDWLACPAHAAECTDYAHATPSHSSARHAGSPAQSVSAAAHTIHRRDVRRLRLFLLTLRECVVRLQDELQQQQQQQQTVLSGNKDGTAHPHNNDAEDEEGSQTKRSTNRRAAAGVDGAKLYDYLYGVLPPHWRGDGGGDDGVLTVVELPSSSSSSSSSITALSPSLSDFSMGGDGLRSPQQRRRRRRVRRHGHFAATSSSSLLHRPRGVAGDGGASPTSSSSDTEDNYARQEEEDEGMISDAFSLGLRSAPTNSNGSSSCSNAGNSQADSASQSQ